MFALTYYMKVLNIRFGGDITAIYATTAVSSLLGVSIGYMVGHLGTAKEEVKETILLIITVGGGFMSGLMYPDMKAIIEEKFPLFNRINPSAVLTDTFLSLNLYGVGERYYRTMGVVAIMTVVCMAVGIVCSRRKQYASL
jgi:ABC-2 type transport system permease protein